ncbi:hypothetical protein JXL21_05065 [Candidatus Bathyarchaeota archaeon]|nr:hypothetical protein [Candidatus Bathyarchaeota archaeon]
MKGWTNQTEEKVQRLIEYIEENDFWVTSQQCAEVYGCETSGYATLLIRELKRAKRLPRSFKLIQLTSKGVLSRNIRLVPRLIALERKALDLSEMAEKLKLKVDELRSMRVSLKKAKHPKYLEALDERKKRTAQMKLEQKDILLKSERDFNRMDDCLREEIGMGVEELNIYNAVNHYSESLLTLLGNSEKNAKTLNLDKRDTGYLRRYGLVKSGRNPLGGTRLSVTLKAMSYLFIQGHVHPSPRLPEKVFEDEDIPDEEMNPPPVTWSVDH